MNLNLPKPRKLIRDASVFRRLIAFIIDLLIINMAIVTPFRNLLSGFFGTDLSLTVPQHIPFYIYFALFNIVLLSWAYFSLTQYFLDQTIGMRLLKIQVKGKLNLPKSFLRNIFVFPFFPFYLLWILEPIVILIKKQGILDRITSTKMIETIEMV